VEEPGSDAWIPSPGTEEAGALPGTVNAPPDPWLVPSEKADGEPTEKTLVPPPLDADAGG
jgi:hypothetical protein